MMNFKNKRNNGLSILKTVFPIFSAILLLATNVFATTATLPSIFDVMNYQEVLEVTMEGDFTTLKNSRRSGEAQAVKVSFVDAAGKEQIWKTKITLRGHFRRMRCTAMPPMKLNFKKGALKEAGLSKFDDMKLVTQCMEEDEEAGAAILKEYLAYKLYNGITAESFRVQLLKVTYKDTGAEGSTIKQWGFLIEDTAQLRNRLSVEKSEQERGFASKDFHATEFYKMAVFQYLIGNGDWDILAGRNVKIVIKDGKRLVIPYDFDFSGMVNTSYAIPNANYGMASVQERVYMGFEEDMANLEETLAYYKSQKKVLRETVKAFKVLKTKNRREVLNYLDTFYHTMDTVVYRPKKTATMLDIAAQLD